ncbi:hypothetical protein ACM92K_004439, partial [Cronobacter turicensis]
SKKEPVRKYGLFCFYIAPGKRQVRSAYLPYNICLRYFVGWVSGAHPPSSRKENAKDKNKKSPTSVGLFRCSGRRA